MSLPELPHYVLPLGVGILILIIFLIIRYRSPKSSIPKTPRNPPSSQPPASVTPPAGQPVGAGAGPAGNNQQTPPPRKKWGWAVLGIICFLWLTIWLLSPSLPASAIDWSFHYQISPAYTGEAKREGDLAAEVIRYNGIGDDLVLEFETYFKDKDYRKGREPLTRYFQFDSRNGVNKTWQVFPADTGTFLFRKSQIGEGLSGSYTSQLFGEVDFDLVPE